MKKFTLYIFLLTMFSILFFKLIYISKDKEYYDKKLSAKTDIVVYGPSSPRGRILDRNGKVLVDNEGTKAIYYEKLKGITTEKELEISKKLASILSVPSGSISALKTYYLATNNNGKNLITSKEYDDLEKRKITKKELEKRKIERITDEMINYDEENKKAAYIYSVMNTGYLYSKKLIFSGVSDSEYAKVIEKNLPGIIGGMSWKRKYLYNDTLKNIFGSIGKIPEDNITNYLKSGYSISDTVGISYLEKVYDNYLQGKKAIYKVNKDKSLYLVKEEEKGNDLVLSIDIELQEKIEEILKDKITLGKTYPNTEYYKDSYALLSDPSTGEVLAIAGQRLNDDNTFSDISLNTINTSFTVGSSVKGATIAVGYQNGLITPGEYVNDACVKLYYIPKKCSFKNLGKINDLTALANSSNYYQYLIAIKLTGNTYTPNMKLNASQKHFDIYRSMLASFGLGTKTGIDLPLESEGLKGEKIADDLLLNLSIGQYDAYTPVQMLQYTSSLATGKRTKLSLMKEIRHDSSLIYENKPEVLNSVSVDEVYQERIKEGLRLVLKEGTGKIYVPKGLDFAGKTGTSESFLDINNDKKVDVATISSSFIGFYPSTNPRYSLIVMTPNISHKKGRTDGFYYGASKITKDIINVLLEKENTN